MCICEEVARLYLGHSQERRDHQNMICLRGTPPLRYRYQHAYPTHPIPFTITPISPQEKSEPSTHPVSVFAAIVYTSVSTLWSIRCQSDHPCVHTYPYPSRPKERKKEKIIINSNYPNLTDPHSSASSPPLT